jgi:altronate hydrolase
VATERFADFALQLRAEDNVAVAKRDIPAGTVLERPEKDGWKVTARRDIPFGHKFALARIDRDDPVRKYGQVIGFAESEIQPGDHVHVHNLAMREFARDYAFGTDAHPVDYYPAEKMRTFPGFLRTDGKVGTRNYVAVISSVNCSASVSNYVADRFRNDDFRREFPNVDGVLAFTHKGGCGVQPGEPHQILQRVLAGVARHPNIAGYVMIGLGCEINQAAQLVVDQRLNILRPGEDAPAVMNIQSEGGVRKTIEAGVGAIRRILPKANAAKRTPQPLSKLVLALNCGGSDGNSGITANPALGVASDELVRYGGTAVLAETPEIYGAEQLLTRRAVTPEVGKRLIERVKWWEDHVRQHGATLDGNPSYGNKKGGLTTIYEKSLGAVAKGGSSPLAAVYKYAEPINTPGFGFMDTPGYDPVSMTGLVAGGCNIGVFTTGRGSVYGCKPAPCIKVATNTPMFTHMEEDMDLNAGTVLEGESLQAVGMRLFEMIVRVAGGEHTKSELAGIGDAEFAPWMIGVTF